MSDLLSGSGGLAFASGSGVIAGSFAANLAL